MPLLEKYERIRNRNTLSHQGHRAIYKRSCLLLLDQGHNNGRHRSGKEVSRGWHSSPEQDYPRSRLNSWLGDTCPTSPQWQWPLPVCNDWLALLRLLQHLLLEEVLQKIVLAIAPGLASGDHQGKDSTSLVQTFVGASTHVLAGNRPVDEW